MSRVTPPVQKMAQVVRGISSTSTARASSILLNHEKSKAEVVDRLNAPDKTSRSHTTLSSHRPVVATHRVAPFMQGFTTTAPRPSRSDSSSIDFMFLPAMSESSSESFVNIRVPLLPDNYAPDRSVNSMHAHEAVAEAIPSPEIHVIAAHPERVSVSTLTEVVGNEGLELHVEELTKAFRNQVDMLGEKLEAEKGTLKQLWSGLVDDVLGPKAKPSF